MSALELDRVLAAARPGPTAHPDPTARLAPTAPIEPLTARELVVLRELSRPATLEDIAAELWVSRNTVKSQVRSLYRKIGASRRSEAVAWAEAAGMV